MEAIGLVVGVAGLARLFSTCISCFELVQRGRYLGKEYILLETKFSNQRLRLLTWGRACGFVDSDIYDERFDDEEVRPCIEATLIHLITLFNDGKELKMKYGLKPDQPRPNVLAVASSVLGALIPPNLPITTKLGQKIHGFRDRMGRTQKNATFANTVRWAIEDKLKFTELVQHLKDLIDDLEGLTKCLGIPARQRDMIRCEVESISDIAALEIIEEARWGRVDAVSDAASLRLWKLRDRYLESEQGNRPANPDQSPQGSVYSKDIEWDDMANDAQNRLAVAVDSHYQLLYRIFCQHEPTSVFLDPPSYSTRNNNYSQWVVLDTEHPAGEPKALHLCGRRAIPDLDAYLTQNCELLFVVFKNYRCCHDWDQQKESGSLAFDQSVYLSSADLCSALRNLSPRLTHLPRLPDFQPRMELQAPYLWYYHLRKLLSIELNDLSAQAWKSQGVKTLMDFVSGSMAEEYSIVEALLSRKVISWVYLQYLFVQGDVILQTNVKSRDHYQGYELIASPTVCNADKESACLELNVFSWTFDGNYQRTDSTLTITRSQFGNSEEALLSISSLPVLPLSYAEDCSREFLEHRGKLFWKCRSRQFVSYYGQTADSKDFIRDSRFMIDTSTYTQLHSDGDTSANSFRLDNGLGSDAMASDRPPDGNFLILLPPTIYGYDMHEHRWRKLLVSNTAPVIWNKNSFEHLVLPQRTKDRLITVVTSMISNGNVDNSTSGKSDGLVLLLQGARESGKTFAAEAIAEFIERPLHRIDCVDIGNNVEKLERYLQFIFQIRTTWGCVVHLDDANMFIKAGNALMSVFLRFLKYYDGILIITSDHSVNMVEVIKSRIHVVLFFGDLDYSGRTKMWRNSVHGLQKTNFVANVDGLLDKVTVLAELELNARQIRDMIRKAICFANVRGETLDFSHFEAAMEAFYRGFIKNSIDIDSVGAFDAQPGDQRRD